MTGSVAGLQLRAELFETPGEAVSGGGRPAVVPAGATTGRASPAARAGASGRPSPPTAASRSPPGSPGSRRACSGRQPTHRELTGVTSAAVAVHALRDGHRPDSPSDTSFAVDVEHWPAAPPQWLWWTPIDGLTPADDEDFNRVGHHGGNFLAEPPAPKEPPLRWIRALGRPPVPGGSVPESVL